MNLYLEQSVNGSSGGGKAALYVLCWALMGILLIGALISAAGIMDAGGEEFKISWLNLLSFVLCLGIAVLVYRLKDNLRVEYDYILKDSGLEIYGILNRKRRKKYAQIALDKVRRAGPADCAAAKDPGAKQHDWHIGSSGLVNICYMEENARHMAVLELNDELLSGLKSKLDRGVWRGEEGKFNQDASLS